MKRMKTIIYLIDFLMGLFIKDKNEGAEIEILKPLTALDEKGYLESERAKTKRLQYSNKFDLGRYIEIKGRCPHCFHNVCIVNLSTVLKKQRGKHKFDIRCTDPKCGKSFIFKVKYKVKYDPNCEDL